MPRLPSRSSLRRTALCLALTAALAGCGLADDETGSTPPGGAAVTLENCGAEVTIEAPPEQVVLLKSAAVPYLHELGVLDRVTARAGQYPTEYYDDETLAELDEIPLLTDELDTSGHLQISQEVVIAEEPDLVLGEVENLSRDALAALGIPLLEEPAMCGAAGSGTPTFADVSDQLRTYGRVFDREERAEDAVAELEQRLAGIAAEVDSPSGRTAAVLYPTVGGGTTYAYGNRSMADPQLAAAGLENVFADVDERVFEVTLEELLGRDPDVLVLLHSEGDPDEVVRAVTDLPGADALTAVGTGDLMPQLLNFTEPPTPLSIVGLERIVERFGSGS